MNVQQTIQKWGNSSGVRLPKVVLKAANFKPNQLLDIHIQNGSVVLTPVRKPANVSLQKMLAGVSPSDIGGEISWGEDLGAERYE